MKHTPKKSHPSGSGTHASPVGESQPTLLDSAPSIAPITGTWLTVAQLNSLLPFPIDDATLRRLANVHNPNPVTRLPWLPAPRSARWQYPQTLLGLLAWYHHRASATADLPAQYSSMTHMATALHLPQKAIKWTIHNGAPDALDATGRVTPALVIAKMGETVLAVATGQYQTIPGMEEVDTNREVGLKVRAEREALERRALLEQGQMLLTRDGAAAFTELQADEYLWEKTLAPLRTLLTKAPAQINRQHKTIFNSDAKIADQLTTAAQVVTTTIAAILEKLRRKIPARQRDVASNIEEQEAA